MAGYLDASIAYTLIAVLVRCAVFGAMGIYRRFWRYASVEDMVQIGLALFASSLFLIFIALAMRLLGVPLGSPLPRSVPIMESLLVAAATIAARLLATPGRPLAHRPASAASPACRHRGRRFSWTHDRARVKNTS